MSTRVGSCLSVVGTEDSGHLKDKMIEDRLIDGVGVVEALMTSAAVLLRSYPKECFAIDECRNSPHSDVVDSR